MLYDSDNDPEVYHYCTRKTRYSYDDAMFRASSIVVKGGAPPHIYACPNCGVYHVGHPPKNPKHFHSTEFVEVTLEMRR